MADNDNGKRIIWAQQYLQLYDQSLKTYQMWLHKLIYSAAAN